MNIYNLYNTSYLVNKITFDECNRRDILPRHYFNNIHYSSIPFFLSFKIFNLVVFFVLFLNKFTYINDTILLISLVGVVFYLIKWFYDIMVESSYLGRYTRKVRASIIFGFFLFLLSEIMLFSGFFWSFFDRIFNLSYATYNMSQLNGFELITWYTTPLCATVLLLTSGYTLNYVYYLLRMWGNIWVVELYLLPTILMAMSFVLIQYVEYRELTFTISDGVYSSLFFLLTGFHGMHVIVGTIFILYTLKALNNLEITTSRNIRVGLALIYWHFVDIIWIFLFMFIYVLNSWDFIFLIKKLNYIMYVLY